MELSHTEEVHLREGTIWNFRGTGSLAQCMYEARNRLEALKSFMKVHRKSDCKCKHLT